MDNSYKSYNDNKNYNGYKDLPFFRQAEIIHDFTAEFTQKYIDYKSRTRDQTCLPAGRWIRQPGQGNRI